MSYRHRLHYSINKTLDCIGIQLSITHRQTHTHEMPLALILYTDGKLECVDLTDYGEYNRILGGYMAALPARDREKRNLRCYVNDDALPNDWPINPYSSLLCSMGATMNGLPQAIYGHIIVTSSAEDGEDGPVDANVVALCTKYQRMMDNKKKADAFITNNRDCCVKYC